MECLSELSIKNLYCFFLTLNRKLTAVNLLCSRALYAYLNSVLPCFFYSRGSVGWEGLPWGSTKTPVIWLREESLEKYCLLPPWQTGPVEISKQARGAWYCGRWQTSLPCPCTKVPLNSSFDVLPLKCRVQGQQTHEHGVKTEIKQCD